MEKLIAGLERLGKRENTLIIFVGDDGTGGNGKAQTSEMGARVPFIANGPGLAKPVGECRELVDLTDIVPSICEVAGIKIPQGLVGQTCTGCRQAQRQDDQNSTVVGKW